jgi:monothiol glutaredoxin
MNATLTTEKTLKIVAYLKPTCGWSQGVRSIMRKYNLPYEDRDVVNNPAIYSEMVEKSGQELSPCVEIDGNMLADVSGSEVEAYLLKNGLVESTEAAADMPTDRACSTHHRG